ncbi:MAG TPA: alpha/beta hydrolase [Cryobacterium sp.]|nr:alpha/beta hydrolase [Cryobacterium sp.]
MPNRGAEPAAAEPLWLNLSARNGTSVGVPVAGDPRVSAQPIASVPRSGTVATVESVRGMTGAKLLDGLSTLSVADMTAFVQQAPGQVDALLTAPPAASAVAGLWTDLGAAERSSLLAAAPRLVGNLEGVPFRERGRANARYLTQSLADVTQRLADATDGNERAVLTRELAVLTQIKSALRTPDGAPRRSLILLDPTGGGRAAIALGNPDTADFVTYLVPGMNYAVEQQIVNWTDTAGAVYAEQIAVLRQSGAGQSRPGEIGESGDSGGGVASVATIAWIGYETPHLFNVGGTGLAEAGADFLEQSALGIAADRGTRQPHVSVLAHSYGSTVALTALARGTFGVDALVLVGSPGSQVQSVDSLNVAPGNVYVGSADWDPTVNSAFFGSDPGAESYGANALGVSGGRDRVTGSWLTGSVGHNAYFDSGSESLHNMALIGTGNADLVTDGSE